MTDSDAPSIPDLARAFFDDLAQRCGEGYERRPQQVDMSIAVARAFEANGNMCVEAPTGVGKTIAYLVPSLLFAMRESKPVVVSTHTIALQGQIVRKDIPIIESVIDAPIRAVTLKGRGNYLCLRRLALASMRIEQGNDRNKEHAETLRLLRAHALRADAETVIDKDSLPTPVTKDLFDAINSDHACPAQSCPFHHRCFLFKARRLAETAQIVIVNHALLLASLKIRDAMRGKALLSTAPPLVPDHCAVIIDEAHTLIEVASGNLGEVTSTGVIEGLLHELLTARDAGNPRPDLRKERLLHATRDAELIRAVRRQSRKISLFAERLSQHLHTSLVNQRDAEQHVIRDAVRETLIPCVTSIQRELSKRVDPTDDEEEECDSDNESQPPRTGSALAALRVIRSRLADAIDALSLHAIARDDHIARPSPDAIHVCYCDTAPGAPGNASIRAPIIDPSALLRRLLLSHPPVILTSATIAIRGDMTAFQRRIEGDDERGHTTTPLVLATPFDYSSNVKVHIAQNAPDPSRAEDYLDFLCHQIPRFLRMTLGGGWVLFTSYETMNACADRLAPILAAEQLPLIVQSRDAAPADLIEMFKRKRDSALFATASFWTGVDVAGEGLRNVIITKLPFPSPADPLAAARARHLASQGKDPFPEYYLPEAVIRLRQGFGRLMRRGDDRGIVVILDSRVLSKPYGREFLAALPQCPVELF